MAKRKGINSRKKYAQRKHTVVKGFRKVLPLIAVIIAVVAVACAAVYTGILSYQKIASAVDKSDLFSVKTVSVRGNVRLADADIIALSGLKKLSKVYKVQSSAVTASLLADPWIEKARCVRKWWGAVTIEITERTPIALVCVPEVRLVDRHGVIMPLEPGKTYDLPIITGTRFRNDRRGNRCVDSAYIGRAARFIDRVRTNSAMPCGGISQLDIRDAGMVRCRVASSPVVIDIDYDADAKQLRNLKYLLTTLAETPSAAARIDLRYENIAFVSEPAAAPATPQNAVN